ncbi:MAG: hypothetical protein JKX70_05930 [Phycisphaerales bacterium]|nr:hypothetical protein [Phycisphaerales bacterium]
MIRSPYHPLFVNALVCSMVGSVVGSVGLVLCILPACTAQQSNQQRVIRATEHIEDPIRTLEARAELESLETTQRVDDAIIKVILPDALETLAVGSSAYQKALSVPAFDAEYSINDDTENQPNIDAQDIDQNRRTHAIKLYARARSLRQRGELGQAQGLYQQAAKLDPSSASIQRELGSTLVLLNDRTGAINAFERAYVLGDRSPRMLVHLAGAATEKNEYQRSMMLTTQALGAKTLGNHPMARSIAGVLLGTGQINDGYLKAGAQTLGEALDSFDYSSRDLRWKREIIQVVNQRSNLWILTGDAWASIGAHQRAQEAYANAGQGVKQAPLALVSRQISSALRAGHPSKAALLFLSHLELNANDLGTQELRWASALASIEGVSDVFGSAIKAASQNPGNTDSTRQSLLGIELASLSTTDAIARLGSAGLDANSPLIFADVLGKVYDESERYQSALSILEVNPQVSRAIASGFLRTLSDPVAFMREHNDVRTESAQLLLASLGISLHRADLIGHLDTLEYTQDRTADWIAIHIQALALTGKFDPDPSMDSLRSWLEHTSEQDDRHTTRLRASTLIIDQHPAQAWELIKAQANDADADVHDLMLGAQIAQTLGDFDSAVSFLERASELDPYNEMVYEQLFSLRSSASPLGDSEELRYLVRQLSSARPRSAFFGLIRATELARNGFVDEAELLLKELNQSHPQRGIGYELLMSIWKTQSTQDQPDALVDGIEWLKARLTLDPNSTSTALLIAQGLVELKEYDQTRSLLTNEYARTGSFELARALEQLLAGPLEMPDEAESHFVARLEGLHGVDLKIEYARHLATQSTSEANESLRSLLSGLLPDSYQLLPSQRERLTRVVFSMANAVETLNHEADILWVISVIENHSLDLGYALSRVKVLLMASLPEIDMEQIIQVVHQAVEQTDDEEDQNTLRGLPIRALLGENRTHEAIMLITRFATHENSLDSDFAVETFQLLAAVGTNANMIGVLDLLEERGLMQEMIKLTTTRLGTPDRGRKAETLDQMRADLAYTAAALTTSFERDDQSASYYQLSLSYDPDHPWSNNDYGYMLAETGERMDYAVELLERAAKALPQEASVIDSLAWVRYKLGIFDDVADEDGELITEGAIRLLERATQLDIERSNPTIMLHLGDALWRGGYKERANEAWLGAEDITRSGIRLIKSRSPINQRALDAMSIELRSIRYRLQDAENNGNPQVAPLADRVEAETDTE